MSFRRSTIPLLPLTSSTQNATNNSISKITPMEGTTIIHPKTATDTIQQPQHQHINGLLLAAVAIVSLLLGLAVAALASKMYSRALKSRMNAGSGHSADDIHHGGEDGGLALSKLDTDRDCDVNSLGKFSRTTCDTCSTRKLYLPDCRGGCGDGGSSTCTSPRPRLRKYAPSMLRIATSRQPVDVIESQDGEVGEREDRQALTDDDRSFQFEQALLESPILGKVLTEKFDVESPVKEGNFDWNRCAFEEKEEAAMWLPSSRSESQLATRYTRAPGSHGRAASDPTLLLSYPPQAYFTRPSGSPHPPLRAPGRRSAASSPSRRELVRTSLAPSHTLRRVDHQRYAEEERSERRRLEYERLRPRTSPNTVQTGSAEATLSIGQIPMEASDGSKKRTSEIDTVKQTDSVSKQQPYFAPIELESPSHSKLMARRGALVEALLPVSR